jgi:branched-chain amino acid transport system permease protein
MRELIQSLMNGVLLGGLYVLIGIGMSLIFGVMKMTNLAHGDFLILSAFFSMTLITSFSGNILLSLLITIIIMAALGFLVQNFVINKVVDKGAEPTLLVTFGISIIVENVLQLIYGANPRSIPVSFATQNVVATKYFSISAMYLVDFIVAVAVILLLSLIMKKTFFGISARASSSDAIAAELRGINTKRVYAYTMCLAMATACIAGLLVGMTFVFYPTTGSQYLIIAFSVVVIGGMGSIFGTLFGGIILGLAQLLGGDFFGAGNQMACAYVVLLIILTFKPEGLLTKAARR